ncbi:unnamed protein product [Trichogramma brassicae]|uniref:Uncharacterized protein n=1 Tax=Trichogramma brassicae TaxID=86971 RepID=A0A6H5J3H6_9HYME|nr:unnamed protein product [Trichogramma brassicae]
MTTTSAATNSTNTSSFSFAFLAPSPPPMRAPTNRFSSAAFINSVPHDVSMYDSSFSARASTSTSTHSLGPLLLVVTHLLALSSDDKLNKLYDLFFSMNNFLQSNLGGITSMLENYETRIKDLDDSLARAYIEIDRMRDEIASSTPPTPEFTISGVPAASSAASDTGVVSSVLRAVGAECFIPDLINVRRLRTDSGSALCTLLVKTQSSHIRDEIIRLKIAKGDLPAADFFPGHEAVLQRKLYLNGSKLILFKFSSARISPILTRFCSAAIVESCKLCKVFGTAWVICQIAITANDKIFDRFDTLPKGEEQAMGFLEAAISEEIPDHRPTHRSIEVSIRTRLYTARKGGHSRDQFETCNTAELRQSHRSTSHSERLSRRPKSGADPRVTEKVTRRARHGADPPSIDGAGLSSEEWRDPISIDSDITSPTAAGADSGMASQDHVEDVANFRGSFFRLVWSSLCPRWSGYHSKEDPGYVISLRTVKTPDQLLCHDRVSEGGHCQPVGLGLKHESHQHLRLQGPPKRRWSTSLSSVNRGQRKATCSTSSTAAGHTGHRSLVSLLLQHRYDLKQP